MATSKRLKLEVDLPDDDSHRRKDARQEPRRTSRLAWFASRLMVMGVLLAVLVGLGPTIISATGLWKSLLAAAAPDLAGKVDAGSLSLAWWSPIEVKGLIVRGDDGEVLVEAPLVRSHKTLLAIAGNYQDLGVFEITEPRAKVVLRPRGSNIEDFLAKLPKDESDGKGSPPMRVGLLLTRGTIELDDTIARRQWSLENVNLDVAWPTAADQPKTGKLTASMKPLAAATPAGEVSAEFTWQPGADEATALGAGQAEIKLSGLPTELLEGALCRFATDIRPQGQLTLDAGYVWTEGGKSQHLIVRQLAAPQLVVASPTLLANDRLAAAIAMGQADVLITGDKIDIKQLRLESNLMQLSGKGSASLGSPADASDVEVTGQIDLAELARQLPGTLRMQQGAQLTSGVVQVSLVNRMLADGRQWQGSLKTNRIEATNAGRPIVFDQPLEIGFTVRETPQGIAIDQLIGKASFLNLNGRGTLAEGTITADADLDKLVAELGRLVDWRDVKLAGTLGAEMRWSQPRAGAWTARADARVRNFVLAAAGLAPWQERDLQIGADLTGVLVGASLAEVTSGKLTINSEGDRLEMTLAEPVKEVSAAASWPLAFTLQGDLATWMPRVQPVVSLAGWQFAGTIDAQGAGRFSPTLCQLGQTTVSIEQLEVAGPNLWIREPIVKLGTSGTWDQAKLTLTLPATTLESTSIALRADEIRLVAGEQPAVTGLVDFRGNPARLSDWIGAKGAARSWQIGGELTGRIEIADRGPAHEATIQADIQQFVLLTPQPPPQQAGRAALASATTPSPWQRSWSESKVTLTGQANYDPAAATLAIARGTLATDWASVAATGSIAEVTSRCLTDLSGEITYDLSLVEQKIKTDLFPRTPTDDPSKTRSIDTLVLQGQEKRPFVLKGPLFSQLASTAPADGGTAFTPLVPEELVGEASLGWQGAQYVGLVAGPADFKAQLKQGTVFVGPLDIPVSDGRLTTAPRILLNQRVPSLVVDRGPLIQNVRITPEMCNQWLKYVAPLLADATEAEGKFSLNLEGASVPVFTPLASTVQGSLAIHGAQVGPGPLAKQYLGMARQLKSFVDPAAAAGDNYGRWLLLPEHNVAFAVQDGIVSHDGLTMTAQNFVVTTKGQVRIEDQAIDLDANIPIQESWFKKDQKSLAASLRGKAIPVKVAGTLSQPKLDGKSLQGFGQQLAGAAVKGYLDQGQQKVQGLLQKEAGKVLGGLDGLFGPKPKPAPAAP